MRCWKPLLSLVWSLYDLFVEPGEINDLSAENPELTAEPVAEWEANWQ